MKGVQGVAVLLHNFEWGQKLKLQKVIICVTWHLSLFESKLGSKSGVGYLFISFVHFFCALTGYNTIGNLYFVITLHEIASLFG